MKRMIVAVVLASVLLSALGVQTVAAENASRYTVQPGDTMLKIAARFGVNVVELAQVNAVAWDSWVYVGQRIMIPKAGEAGSASDEESAPVDLVPDPKVPNPIPALPILAQDYSGFVLPHAYARVVQDNAPVFSHPSDAVRGQAAKRTLGSGFVWVSVEEQVSYEGQDYYRINADEYVLAEALSFYRPSDFQGVALAAQPERPFAWILKPIQPLVTPGGELNSQAAVYQRYDLVQIFAVEHLGEQVWYLIGPHQWINQIYVGKVTPSVRPEGVPEDARWFEVDLFEQTLAAYEGDRMVYATLVSSGLRGWDTPEGLFQVWLRLSSRKMSGGYNRPDYYFLEDVTWTQYFNRDIALHTAYWHDGYGYRRSHGCVNLAPRDAKWLFDWAPEDAWVWVH